MHERFKWFIRFIPSQSFGSFRMIGWQMRCAWFVSFIEFVGFLVKDRRSFASILREVIFSGLTGGE
jgi:hypothetical protein